MYVKSFLVTLAVLTFCASAWAGEVMVQQQDSSIVTAQLERKPNQFRQIGPKQFDRYEHGYVEMSPATLTIRYGGNVSHINQGQRKMIDVPENSPILDSDGKLSVTIKYGLKNKTTKRLRFRVGLWYGNKVIAHREVIFFAQQTINIQHKAKLTPVFPRYLPIRIEGLNILDYPDDTRPIFFNGRLSVRVYAL